MTTWVKLDEDDDDGADELELEKEGSGDAVIARRW